MSEEIEAPEPTQMDNQRDAIGTRNRRALFPQGVESQRTIQSRIVLSNDVPQNNLDWLNPALSGELRNQNGKIPFAGKFLWILRRFWNRHALWQYVLILLIAGVTIFILNTLTQTTVRPGTTVGPRR